jgi:hypothetical protein
MTNTLHRFGKPESLRDDFIVFIMASRGINDLGASEKIRTFLETAVKHDPVNIGNSLVGSLFRPEKDLNFKKVYFTGRKEQFTAREVIETVDKPAVAAVVFDNQEAMEGFIKDVKALDLGLSVNVSALVEETKEACRKKQINLHSIEYSLGFNGNIDRLPDRHVLSLTTMCGHSLISADFAKKMITCVKESRLSPEKAATYMAKFCICGAFNTTRAIRILNEIRMTN